MGNLNRYPGPRPFTQGEAAQFFGRKHDVEQLYKQVLLNSCTLLVGKSGMGKTSLINAGLLPRIEQEINQSTTDNRNLRTVLFTFSAFNPNDTMRLVQKVNATILESLGELSETAENFLHFLPEDLRHTLNFSLKKYQLHGYLKQQRTFFLIIFDQIEQLYSFPVDQVEEFEKELKELVNPNLPDDLQDAMDDGSRHKDFPLKSHEIAMLENPVNVKFLFSIRNDRMNLLIRLRLVIPDILLNPYEIKPMDTQQAKSAITEPAAIADERFKSAPFQYSDSVLNRICEFIAALPSTDFESKFYAGRIEPIILQIICRYIEQAVAPLDIDHLISDEEIDLSSVLENFYAISMASLQLPENELKQVQILLEEKLIYEESKRRLVLYEGMIKKLYRVPQKTLDQLSAMGLLRSHTLTGFERSYEIAHDWLVTPILAARDNRITKQNFAKDSFLLRIADEISQKKGDTEPVLKRADYFQSIGQFNDAIADYTMAMSMMPAKSFGVLLKRANAYIELNKLAEAENDLQTILEGNQGLHEAIYWMAVLRYKQSNKTASIDLFNQYLGVVPNDTGAINFLGIIAMDAGELEQSNMYFKRVVELNPNHQTAMYNLGVNSYEAKNDEEAKGYFEMALALAPEYRLINLDAASWNYLGLIITAQSGKMDEGIEYFQKSIELVPQNGYAQFNLGRAYMEGQRWDDALICFKKVVRPNPKYAEANNYIGTIYSNVSFKDADLDKADEAFNIAYSINPAVPDYVYNVGWVAYNKGELTLAQEKFEEVLKLVPGNPEVLNYLGLIAENRDRDYVAAKAWYARGLETSPQHLYLLYNYGRLCYNTNALDEAKMYMQKVLEINPDYGDAMNYLGLIEKLQNNLPQAEEWFLKTIQHSPAIPYPYYNLGIINYDRKEFEAAKSYFQKNLELVPNGLNSYNYLGLIAENAGSLEEAVKIYQKAVDIDNDFALAQYNLGIVLYKTGEYDRAAVAFNRAIDLKQYPATCFNYLGSIAFVKNDLYTAIDYYKKTLELDTQNDFAIFNLANCYFDLARYEEAYDLWMQLLNMLPDDWEVKWYMARTALKLGKITEAEAIEDTLRNLANMPAEKLELLKNELAASKGN